MTTDRPMLSAAMRLRSVSSILSGLGLGLHDQHRFALQSLVAAIDMVADEIDPGAGDGEGPDDGPAPYHDRDDCNCCEADGPEPTRSIDLPYALRHIFLAMPPGGEVIIRRDREG